MKLGLDTIKELGDKGNDKERRARRAVQATKDRSSVLGTYSFDANGDTTLTDYGLYKVGPDGNPAFDEDDQGRRPDQLTRRGWGRAAAARPRRARAFDAMEATHRQPLRSPSALRPRRRAGVRARSRTRTGLIVLLLALPVFYGVKDLTDDGQPRPPRPEPLHRALQRLDLGADRHRLHAGLRHHRADQLRPRRRVHDRLVRRARVCSARSASTLDDRRRSGIVGGLLVDARSSRCSSAARST